MTRARGILVAVLLAAGCRQAPTTVRVSLTAVPGMSADAIALTVFDRHGRIINGANLGGADKLPGDVVVLVDGQAGEARAFALAADGSIAVGGGAGRVPILRGQEVPLGLELQLGTMSDIDHDGVPDAIDNCPTVFNPDQTSSDGSDVGDAGRDLGGGDSDGGVGNGGNGGGGGGGGAGGAGGGGGGGGVPPGCGDGVVDPGEQCDKGSGNSDDPASPSTCTTMCKSRAPCGTLTGALGAKIDPATGHCYVAWAGPSNWATAQRACQAHGGYLAVVTSASENAVVNTVGGSASPQWIGLEVTPGTPTTFRWVDGEPYQYSAWAPGQPDNGGGKGPEECTARTLTGWDDMPCGFPSNGDLPPSTIVALGYVCESSCGNGVVDPGEECDGGAGCTANCALKRPCTEAGAVSSPFNGHCYFPVGVNVNYSTALSSSCPAGTHLATLADIAESEAGMAAIGANDAWIALKSTQTVGVFNWQAPTSEAFDSRRFHGFTQVEPNEGAVPACTRLQANYGWRDQNCGNTYDAMCERD